MNHLQIPVLLLTGYLGSGKTTLLNRILSNQRGIRFAVIVNDIGEVNIDADLIQKGGVVNQQDDSLVALQNGCICCTLKMDLVKQLQDIIELQRFDYIVIEASGICEPGPIAQTICSIPSMAPEVTENGYPLLDCIVTVVDALRMRDEFGSGLDLTRQNIDEEDIENLVIQQIEFCNIVLLNKAAEVSPEELGRIREIVRGLQPKAEIIECNYGDVELDKILNTNMFDFDAVATSATWIQEVEKHHDEEDEHELHESDDDDDDDEHEHDHDDDEDHRNTVSAPMSTTVVSPLTWDFSTSSSPANGQKVSSVPRASAISKMKKMSATSLSRPASKSASAMRVSGMPPCPRMNWRNSWTAIQASAATGTSNMATACRSSSSSASTSTSNSSQASLMPA